MFETGIKCSFDPLRDDDRDSDDDDDDDDDDEYRIPVHGAPDNPLINLQRGYLALSRFSYGKSAYDRSDIESIFLPIFDRILDLVNEQLDGVTTKGSRAPAKVDFPGS